MRNRIKDFLKERNLTQRDLSEELGITEVSISRYITGERIPSVAVAIKIANLLGCTVDELFVDVYEDNEEPETGDTVDIEVVLKKNNEIFKKNDIVWVYYYDSPLEHIIAHPDKFNNKPNISYWVGRIVSITESSIVLDASKEFLSNTKVIPIQHIRSIGTTGILNNKDTIIINNIE